MTVVGFPKGGAGGSAPLFRPKIWTAQTAAESVGDESEMLFEVRVDRSPGDDCISVFAGSEAESLALAARVAACMTASEWLIAPACTECDTPETCRRSNRCAGTGSRLPAQAATAFHRDWLGLAVRDAWIAWAKTQPAPKPSWLVPYEELAEPDKEADRLIGERVAHEILNADMVCRAALRPVQRAELADLLAEAEAYLDVSKEDDILVRRLAMALRSLSAPVAGISEPTLEELGRGADRLDPAMEKADAIPKVYAIWKAITGRGLT